jgi:hypothetical protein
MDIPIVLFGGKRIRVRFAASWLTSPWSSTASWTSGRAIGWSPVAAVTPARVTLWRPRGIPRITVWLSSGRVVGDLYHIFRDRLVD